MAVYNKPFTGLTLSTTNSAWEVRPLAAANPVLSRVLEHYVGGESTTSTVLRAGVSRVTTEGTGTAPTSYTPNKLNPYSPAATNVVSGALSANVAWGTAQEVLGDPMIVHTFNTFGGTDRWVPQPGEEIYMGFGTGQTLLTGCSFRSISGTPVVSGHLVFEEM